MILERGRAAQLLFLRHKLIKRRLVENLRRRIPHFLHDAANDACLFVEAISPRVVVSAEIFLQNNFMDEAAEAHAAMCVWA